MSVILMLRSRCLVLGDLWQLLATVIVNIIVEQRTVLLVHESCNKVSSVFEVTVGFGV